jgi:hypothetical protein
MKKKLGRLLDHIVERRVFSLTCTLQWCCEEGGGRLPDSTQNIDVHELSVEPSLDPTVLRAAESRFLEDGWKYNYDAGDEAGPYHIACPACAAYYDENRVNE